MAASRKEKKSEMLDVRLPYGLKQDLVKACRERNTTVSDTVRGLIAAHLDQAERATQPSPLQEIAMTFIRNPLKTAGMTLTSVAAALVFAAQPSVADDALFRSFDKNQDGRLADDDGVHGTAIRVLDVNDDGAVDLDEFKPLAELSEVSDRVFADADGVARRRVAVRFVRVAFRDENLIETGTWSSSEDIPVDASSAEVADMIETLKTRNADNVAEKDRG